MSVIELTTLLIALAALITSAVSAYEMIRQSKNAVRPAIVLLEKHAEAKFAAKGDSLYLCNMGNAVAINVRLATQNVFDWNFKPAVANVRIDNNPRSEIAAGRRSVLVSGYDGPLLEKMGIYVTYEDVNHTQYYTLFKPGEVNHRFGKTRGSEKLPEKEEDFQALRELQLKLGESRKGSGQEHA